MYKSQITPGSVSVIVRDFCEGPLWWSGREGHRFRCRVKLIWGSHKFWSLNPKIPGPAHGSSSIWMTWHQLRMMWDKMLSECLVLPPLYFRLSTPNSTSSASMTWTVYPQSTSSPSTTSGQSRRHLPWAATELESESPQLKDKNFSWLKFLETFEGST